MMKQDHPNHPSDGSSNDSFDDFLTKHLQQAQVYLPDDDFTARVIKQLPAPKKLSLWQERLIIIIPLLVISVLVLSQFPVLAVLIKVWVLFWTVDLSGLLQVGFLMSIAAILGATFWFAKQMRVI